jgi:carboxyl-terminal processing protease
MELGTCVTAHARTSWRANVLEDSNVTDTPGEPPRDADATARRERGDQSLVQVAVMALLVVLAFAAGWFGNQYVHRADYVPPQTANGQVNDEYLIVQAWNDIAQHFVVTGAINTKKMAYDAITAMVNDLQDTGHSRFETPQEFQQEQNDLNNAPTVGIGVYLSGGGTQPLRIDAVIPGSPADKSKQIHPGDEIVGVDGKSVRGQTIDQVRPLIEGKAGTKVILTMIRPSVSATQTFDATLTRAQFTAPIAPSYIIPGTNIDDIQITEFANDADSELRTALQQANKAHVKGIVLDLRANPGGLLDQAIAVASEFIPSGPGKNVLIEKTRDGQTTDAVQPGGLATKIPLTILVDGNTASAAEIVTGSIAVNRPDVRIIGQTTYGTGTVLNSFQLADGSVLVLGTEEFLLPNGQSIYKSGCEPDQVVALPAGADAISALAAKEENLNLQLIQQLQDTQLQQAIQDLTNPQSDGPGYHCVTRH